MDRAIAIYNDTSLPIIKGLCKLKTNNNFERCCRTTMKMKFNLFNYVYFVNFINNNLVDEVMILCPKFIT